MGERIRECVDGEKEGWDGMGGSYRLSQGRKRGGTLCIQGKEEVQFLGRAFYRGRWSVVRAGQQVEICYADLFLYSVSVGTRSLHDITNANGKPS